MGWILTIVLGIISALLGGFLAGMLGMNANGGFSLVTFSSHWRHYCYSFYELATGKRRIG